MDRNKGRLGALCFATAPPAPFVLPLRLGALCSCAGASVLFVLNGCVPAPFFTGDCASARSLLRSIGDVRDVARLQHRNTRYRTSRSQRAFTSSLHSAASQRASALCRTSLEEPRIRSRKNPAWRRKEADTVHSSERNFARSENARKRSRASVRRRKPLDFPHQRIAFTIAPRARIGAVCEPSRIHAVMTA